MESKAALKVGVLVAAGLALFGVSWGYLAHIGLNHFRLTVYFKDTKGLLKQTPVRMNGVTIGEVENIDLSQKPEHKNQPAVVLSIDNKYNQIPDDSTITITSGLLISNAQVEIKPGRSLAYLSPGQDWPQDKVLEQGSMLAALSPEADLTLKNLNKTLSAMTQELPDTMKKFKGILISAQKSMDNLAVTTGSARDLFTDPKIRRTMMASLDDLQTMTHETRVTAVQLSKDLRALVKRNSPKFDELANNTIDIVQKLGDTVDAVRSAMTRLTEQISDPRLQQSLLETLDLAKTTIARFNQIASDIHQITGDQATQTNIKEAIVSVKDTGEKMNKLTDQISSLIGLIKPGNKPRFGIGNPQLSVDFFGRTNTPHFRSDVNVRLPMGEKNAFNLGMNDFGDRYRLNAQYESKLSVGAFRYGIYDAKLGVGLGFQSGLNTIFKLDLYDPNNIKFDAKAQIPLTNDFRLWFGADNVFRKTTPVIGVRYSP